jgi:formate-dependent nitrite reductase membrane component NrfD
MATNGSAGTPRKFAAASLWVGVVLIAVSIYFFLASVTLISPPSQAVVAALLSAIIGFVMLSAGTTLVRTYVVARVVEQNPK